MSSLELYVRYWGWFQLRIPTNPDPVSDLWGGNGYTYSLPGERPLDGLIRFHDPVEPRDMAPEVGVRIRQAELQSVDKRPTESIPFESIIGARVELGPDTRFVGENDLVDPMIVYPWPYRFRLSMDDAHILTRGRLPDEEGVEWIERMTREERLAFQKSIAFGGGEITAPRAMRAYWADLKEKAELVGSDARELLRTRADSLSTRLASAAAVERAALSARIWNLLRYESGVPPGQTDRLHDQFYTMASWHCPLDGALESGGWLEKLGLRPVASDPWRTELVMRLWDGDALCGFAKGDIRIRVEETNSPLRQEGEKNGSS